jgi:isocitrate dehydrogenase kinase/phosphatase
MLPRMTFSPETFINFLAFDDTQHAAFMRVHGEVLTAAFWRYVQLRLKEGEMLEVLPYQPRRARAASSA